MHGLWAAYYTTIERHCQREDGRGLLSCVLCRTFRDARGMGRPSLRSRSGRRRTRDGTTTSSADETRTWRPAREHAAMTAEHAGLEQNIKAWDHRDIHARADEISCV